MSGSSYDHAYQTFESCATKLREWHPHDALFLALADHIEHVGKVMYGIECMDSGKASWDDELEGKISNVLPVRSKLWTSEVNIEHAIALLSESLQQVQQIQEEKW